MRPVVRSAEITIHKSGKIVSNRDSGISLWNQSDLTRGAMSEILSCMRMQDPVLAQDIHPPMPLIAKIRHP